MATRSYADVGAVRRPFSPNGSTISGLYIGAVQRALGIYYGLVSRWPLDESSGNALDAQGSNDLTDTNTVTSAAGKVDGARQFTRANAELFSIASNASLQAGDVKIAFAGWVYLDSETGNMVVLGKVSGAPVFEYYLYYDSTAHRFKWVVSSDGSATTTVTADTFGPASTGTWYWLYAEHNPDTNEIGISVDNGTLDTEAHSGGIHVGTADFMLGSIGVGGNTWDGRIDQVWYWKNRLLTSDERTELFESEGGGAPPTVNRRRRVLLCGARR